MKLSKKIKYISLCLLGCFLVLINISYIVAAFREGGDSLYSLILVIPLFALGVVLLITNIRKFYKEKKLNVLFAASHQIDAAHSKADILNSTLDPQEYFSTYDAIIRDEEKLVSMEKAGFFSEDNSPSRDLMMIKLREQLSIYNFLKRASTARAKRCKPLSMANRQVAYNTFCKTLSPYYSRFCQYNVLFLEQDCKEQFLQTGDFETPELIDPLLEQDIILIQHAIEAILYEKRASVLFLELKLLIQKRQAEQIIYILEQIGFIGKAEGYHSHEILVSAEEYQKNPFVFLDKAESFEKAYMNERITDLQDIQAHLNLSSSMDSMSGYEFEEFCCNLLKQIGFSNVTQTKLSGDDGLDIVAEKDDIKYGFQCKCYSSPVGNKAVQEAYTGAMMYHCDVAVVMTNNSFSPQAIRTAEQTRVKLWDRSKIEELLYRA